MQISPLLPASCGKSCCIARPTLPWFSGVTLDPARPITTLKCASATPRAERTLSFHLKSCHPDHSHPVTRCAADGTAACLRYSKIGAAGPCVERRACYGAHSISRERPKEANHTNRATSASAWMANPVVAPDGQSVRGRVRHPRSAPAR